MARQTRGRTTDSSKHGGSTPAPKGSPAGRGPTSRGPRRRRPARRVPRSILAIVAAVVVVAAGGVFLVTRPPHARSEIPPQLKAGAASGYNVLLITLDTMRADHLGCYGNQAIETPTLDGLAQDGMLFGDAVCTAPITLPSHTTMMTGLDPPDHGVRVNGQQVVPADQETLAEILRRAGYQTAAFVSAWVLDSRMGLDQGFDVYDDNIGTGQSSATDEELNQRPAGDVTRAATNWLQQRDRGRPYFAWVHYYDAHQPYSPPQPFASTYRGRPYDGEIAYVDSEIKKLLAAVDAGGDRKRTIVIAVGDHGEGLGQHGESSHERLIYDSVMNIPLILDCPGLFRGPVRVTDTVVSTTDILPTLLTLLGLQASRPLDGLSLMACREQPGRKIYMESMATYLENGWAPLFGIRRHTDKYILAPKPEYYDLARDPKELKNLYRSGSGGDQTARDELTAELSARLARWPSIEGVKASARMMDPETRQRLESLGYVNTSDSQDEDAPLADPKDMMPVLEGINRANSLSRSGQLDGALDEIRAAAALSPRDPRVQLTMGKILLYKEQDELGERALRRSIELHPLPDACLLLAQVLIKHGRYAEAAPILDQGSKLDPLHGGIWIARGDLAAAQKDYPAAIADYQKAVEVDPYRVSRAAEARIVQTRQKLAGGGAR